MEDNNKLSPFEFKEELINLANNNSDKTTLDAGRGNPNFLATNPRHAFLCLGDFALRESERSYAYLDGLFGGVPEKQGITERFDYFVTSNKDRAGVSFLTSAMSFVYDHLGVAKDDFLYDMVNAFLGCDYPNPPRMITIFEEIIMNYLQNELYHKIDAPVEFDVFATEGGTAAMTYIFQSTKINGLIKKGDKIAMITPIFSPYLEIPLLPEYDLEIVHIYAHEENDWQVTSQELTKLEDSDIKMLCLVNPSNPPSVKMSDDVLNDIAELVNTKRPDLMIVTDDVYANFSDDFESLFSRCPFNTLCVYSFSKYFGCTGWRLGTIALHKDNVFDRLLSNVDNDTKDMLVDRYSSLTSQVSELKFMDRIVADSRSVVLNHTAGISLPQQLQMVLFALSGLLDNQSMYRNAAKSIIKRRNKLLYQSISRDIRPNYDSNCVGYYAILDIEYLAKELYGERFSKWLIVNCNINDFLKDLASKTGIVLLPGNGFDVEHPSVRVSLANLREFDYKVIGNNIRNQLDDLYGEFEGV